MKKFTLLLLLSLVAAFATPAFAIDGKVGYVDLQKALNTSVAGKKAKDELGAKVAQYEVQMDARRDELTKAKDDLEKQALLLSAEARDAKERDYQQKLKDFKRFANDIKEELQRQDGTMTRKILDQVLTLVQKIGKEEGYTLIFENNESSLIYADEGIDLTGRVLEAFNASQK